ncbi:Uclacyanin 1 [Zea mays]|uniref:Uclacyanin 1 n=1 Tax=Zea mays TaxID=4577 RepID=A0A3L6FFR0_MAIZE|nr:Uclacyanin 1 [Zea mays]
MDDQRLHLVGNLRRLQTQRHQMTPSAAKMGKMKAVACVACWAALSLVNVVMAVDYVVGNPAGGWDGRTDYQSWAAAETFAPGDTLTFKYNSYHSVMEVTKSAFEACTTTDPIFYDNSGSTTVALTMPGTRYFICGAPGHCLGGMKMQVQVADRPAPTTPSSPPPQPAHAKQKRHATAPSPAPVPWAPAPAPWSPAPAPAAAPPRRAGHKKHKKRYCPPETVHAPARAPTPTVQAVEADFPFAAFAPMTAPPPPPPTSGGLAWRRATCGEATAALAALVWFMLL